MFEKIGPTSLYVLARNDGGDGAPAIQMAAATDAHAAPETHASTQAHGGDAGHKGPFPPFDSTNYPGQLFWLAIFFGLLFFVLAKVVIPRLRNIVEGRAERIAGDLAEANKLKHEIDAAREAYERTLAQARAEGHRIAGDTHEQVSKEAEKQRKLAEVQLGAKIQSAEELIASTKATALTNVRGIAIDAASAIVERLAGKAPAAPEIERAVDASLAK